MADIIEKKFRDWTHGENLRKSRIEIFNRIRDIPYAVLPDLNDPEHYVKILEFNRGSCTPKHFLLADMYRRLGLPVLYAVYPFRWDEFGDLYPPELMAMAKEMPAGFHLACKVEIEGRLVLVDATIDPALVSLGLPVNMDWDGVSDMLLPLNPTGPEQIYHPSEAHLMQERQLDNKALTFYNRLNSWMDDIRADRVDS